MSGEIPVMMIYITNYFKDWDVEFRAKIDIPVLFVITVNSNAPCSNVPNIMTMHCSTHLET